MLDAIFRENDAIWVAFALGCLVLAPALWLFARKSNRSRAVAALMGISLAAVTAATLYPVHGGLRGGRRTCLVTREMAVHVGTQQWQLNVLLFIPLAFFAALLTRRWVLSIVGPVLLSAGIETVQAVSGLGRSCDSSDFTANASGAVAGVLLYGLVRVATIMRSGVRPGGRPVRSAESAEALSSCNPPVGISKRAAVVIVTVTAALTVTWVGWIDRATYGTDGTFPVSKEQDREGRRMAAEYLANVEI